MVGEWMSAKQYHYVVMFDESTCRWEIEWEMTDILSDHVRGIVFDENIAAWVDRGDKNVEEDWLDFSRALDSILEKRNYENMEDECE
jgi:hypothetical protein